MPEALGSLDLNFVLGELLKFLCPFNQDAKTIQRRKNSLFNKRGWNN